MFLVFSFWKREIVKWEEHDSKWGGRRAKQNEKLNLFSQIPISFRKFTSPWATSGRPTVVQLHLGGSLLNSPDFIFSNRSCIRFVPRTPYNKHYIYVTKGPGCSSEVGLRHTGRQSMNINEEFCSRGKIIHELLHSLGFLHMHTAK